PVYGYEFAWPSPAKRGALGACHAVELPFVFGTLGAPGMAAFSGSGPDADRLSDLVMGTWSAFARSGDPANGAIPRWPRHDPVTRPTLIIDRDPRVELAPRDRTLRAGEGLR
ncbi:MAG: carboxylesterase family protein, partial [Myxococcota bacterium]